MKVKFSKEEVIPEYGINTSGGHVKVEHFKVDKHF